MRNNHIKTVELNTSDHTIQIVERDRRGRIFGKSKHTEFTSGVETMKLALTMKGYKFNRATRWGYVFDEVV